MKIIATLISAAVAVAILSLGSFTAVSLAFAGRVPPGVALNNVPLSGVPLHQIASIVQNYENSLLPQTITLLLNGTAAQATLADLGVSVDQAATAAAIYSTSLPAVLTNHGNIVPTLAFDDHAQRLALEHHFSSLITPPRNATLELTPSGYLVAVPSQNGDTIDLATLQLALTNVVKNQNFSAPLALNVITTPAPVQDYELESARTLAEQLLTAGIQFVFQDQTFLMKPHTIRRLLTFVEQVDPENHSNHILGVKLNHEGLTDYLANTIALAIDQPAIDARFTLNQVAEGEQIESLPPRVTQFAVPQTGQRLDVARTASHLAAKLAHQENVIPLAVDVEKPQITDNTDIESLGLTSLLAMGESDFAGSPPNRVHNIKVGAARFHGLLIPPGQEFSFNQYLGPVSKDSGFLPELVIKENVTTPELGGGLCQVSTTAFRAALNAGLEITARRNHAYIVRYYGQPGLDATIYPPSTDLRFVNNTPGYILIQTNIEGTKLTFNFWGTNDGRQVAIAGPVVYDRGSDGSAKAYITQKVTLGTDTVIDDTFYSRYRSPSLFPKVLAAGEAVLPSPLPSPSPLPL